MKSSRITRVLMAAGLYLLLMWGYVELAIPQMFAGFAALIMSIALLFWVNEARAVERLSRTLDLHARGEWETDDDESLSENDTAAYLLSGSVSRLDALKDELAVQYAQLGRDQSAMNIKGLGAWHHNREDDDT